MNRKIIKQGGGGYTIYLPKKWVDRKGLKPGDQINLIESDASLVIGSEIKKKKEITFAITEENKKDITVILTHLYRRGFDVITLTGINSNLLNEIKEITNDLLLGFEVTEKSLTECKLENISEPAEQKYDILLRRVFFIIKETQNIIINDFKDNNFKHFKDIDELRKQQDKYILFCRRILIKEKYEKDPIIQWELLTFLMHIQHASYYLYKFTSENKIKKSKEIIEMLDNLKEYFDLSYNAYFKKDIRYIHRINKLKNKFQFGECFKLLEKSKGKNTVLLSYIREIFRLIQIGSSPILSELLREKI